MAAWLRSHALSALAAPMVVWAAHFVLIYSLAGVACEQGWERYRLWGFDLLSWLLGILAVLALLLIGWLAARAARLARRHGHAPSREGDIPKRPQFVAGAVLALCVLAAIAVVYTTIPIFMLPSCS